MLYNNFLSILSNAFSQEQLYSFGLITSKDSILSLDIFNTTLLNKLHVDFSDITFIEDNNKLFIILKKLDILCFNNIYFLVYNLSNSGKQAIIQFNNKILHNKNSILGTTYTTYKSSTPNILGTISAYTTPIYRGLWWKSWASPNDYIEKLNSKGPNYDAYINLYIYFSGDSSLNRIATLSPPSVPNLPHNCGGKYCPLRKWKWYNNVGGGLATGLITQDVLTDVMNQIPNLIKNNWKGVSFDIEMISEEWGGASAGSGKKAATAFKACFKALRSNDLDVLVSFNHDGYTDQMVQDWALFKGGGVGRELCYQQRDTFINKLSKSEDITYFSPQCYGEKGDNTDYTPLYTPEQWPDPGGLIGQVKYCDWKATVVPSITFSGVDDYLGAATAARRYLPSCLEVSTGTSQEVKQGYIVWYTNSNDQQYT